MTKDNEAAQAAGEAMEQALLNATRSIELELARIIRRVEDDLDRLAGRITETLARLAIDGAIGAVLEGSAPVTNEARDSATGSINQLAAAIARAARRGTRFT